MKVLIVVGAVGIYVILVSCVYVGWVVFHLRPTRVGCALPVYRLC